MRFSKQSIGLRVDKFLRSRAITSGGKERLLLSADDRSRGILGLSGVHAALPPNGGFFSSPITLKRIILSSRLGSTGAAINKGDSHG